MQGEPKMNPYEMGAFNLTRPLSACGEGLGLEGSQRLWV